MANNIFMPFLEENPDILYGGFLGNIGGKSQSFYDYWRSQYGNQYNQYLGQLGGMALSGQEPSMNFYDYLKGYPFLENWFKQSPVARGENPGLSQQRLRWNV